MLLLAQLVTQRPWRKGGDWGSTHTPSPVLSSTPVPPHPIEFLGVPGVPQVPRRPPGVGIPDARGECGATTRAGGRRGGARARQGPRGDMGSGPRPRVWRAAPPNKPDLIRVTHALKINKLSIPSAFHIAASGKMGDSFSEVQRRKRSRGSDRFKSPIKSKRTVVNATASLSPIQRALGTSKLYQACLADCTSVHAANCNDT